MHADDASDLLTIAEAAHLVRVSAVTVQRWLRQGRLPAYRVGPKAVRIRRGDLEKVVTPISRTEEAVSELAPADTAALPRLDDVAAQQAALAAAAEVLAQQSARRGGEPFDESWPLIRAARAERSRRQA